jgi:hypothetical protein
MMNSILGSE